MKHVVILKQRQIFGFTGYLKFITGRLMINVTCIMSHFRFWWQGIYFGILGCDAMYFSR